MTSNPTYIGDEPQPRECAGWIRLTAAAKIAGMSPELFAIACEREQIPVRLRVFGERVRFVNGADLATWLERPCASFHPASADEAENLF